MGMTKAEAVSWLRRCRRGLRINPVYRPMGRRDGVFTAHVYERHLILWLIGRIQESDRDPIDTVQKIYWDMDMFLLGSGNPYTNDFLKRMEKAAGDILDYLREKEEQKTRPERGSDLVLQMFRQMKEGEKRDDQGKLEGRMEWGCARYPAEEPRDSDRNRDFGDDYGGGPGSKGDARSHEED